MSRTLFPIAALAFAAAAVAQVPYGTSVLGVIGNVAPGEGLYLADRAGNNTSVTGLVAAGSSNSNVNAVALDPLDDRVWITSSTTNQLNWVRISGATVTQFTQFGTIPGTGLSAITFDDNANPIVCQGTGTAGLYRFDRKLGGAGTNIGAVPGTNIHNGVCRDAAGNLYVGLFTAGQVHVFTKNPDGSYQAPVLVGATSTTSISGIAYAPADGVNPEEIWVTTFGAAGAQMFRMPVTGGPGVPVANSLAGCNWLDYDAAHNDLLVSTQAGNDRFVQVDRTTGFDTLLSNILGGSAGVPAGNDVDDTVFGAVRVAPMILNGSVGPFDLELSTTAPAGSLALVGVAFPFVNVVSVGIVGPNGRLYINLPNVNLSGPIAPGTLQFLAAYFDPSFNLVIGAPVSWPAL